ncbi:MAG: DUF5696 domain-containing protein, partial [candidate division KSB1 bacterium]|nr:DUF5696 domain-containing protein [candidate division KSB1 bacterium]
QIELEGEWLTYRLLSIDESIPSLIFPAPIFCDAVVIPQGAGRLVKRNKDADIWNREFLPFYTHLNMRMFGGMREGMAWIGIFGNRSADAGAFLYNGLVSPVWLKSLGRWQGDYRFRFKFFKGGYNEIARAYRAYLQERGQFITLTEKAEQNPLVSQMNGGRILSYMQAIPALNLRSAEDYLFTPEQIQHERPQKEIRFTHAQLKKSIDYAKNRGFTKGLVNIRGWINGGYDYSHPDIWPPDPDLGDYRELAQLMASDPTIPFCLHDNYQDIYDHVPSFPNGVLRRPDGSLVHGGLWAGGQAYMLNSRDSLKYVKRNWEKIKLLHPQAMFLDTVTAAKLLQSFEPGNTLTRLQDRELKSEILKFYFDQRPLVGSEEGADFGVPYCHWFENRHERKPGETIPLWSLVFHDAAFAARYITFTQNKPYPKWLEDMLWGYLLLFSMRPEFGQVGNHSSDQTVGFAPTRMDEAIFSMTFHVDRWHEQIGMTAMESHRFINDNPDLEETVFSNGKRIIVNFGSEPQSVDGHAIEGQSYSLED